jgi:hypothetical protein
MMPLDGMVSAPSRAGMSAGLRILGITTRAELQVFASACTGRALNEWELDALEAALQQADQIDRAKREAWDRAALELSLRDSFRDDFPLPTPTYGPGLGEPGRIASALRCARRRQRNRIAAKSRRRNRR